MGSDIILIVLGVMMLLDGLMVFIFPKWVKKFLKKFSKDNVVRMIAVWEIVVAVILIVLGLYF
jgi:uncharacterized protein YjeT (DUF2065 family)